MTALLLLTLLVAAATRTHAAPTSSSPAACVSSCDGLRDGDYQSCHGCHVYVTCTNGNTHDYRPCPQSTVWDDVAKECLYKSTTCRAGTEIPHQQLEVEDDRWCLKSCQGRMDGNYPSCKGLKFYASCSGGVMYDGRPCAPGTEWDNWNKICNHVTTHDVTTVCVTSCEGRPDGNYQSCHGCDVFASCSGGLLTDNRPCPDNNLQWDDRRKDCVYNSSTCPQTNSLSSSSTSGSAAQIGNFRCVSSCYGLPDGDYQSCRGCHYYLSCSNGQMYDGRACPGRLVWDDIIKRCCWGSRTCQGGRDLEGDSCVSQCMGVEDGDYQSCLGCDVYATCSNGIISDNRPCPSGLVWDDIVRECRATSQTCDVTPTSSTTTTTTRFTTNVPTSISSTKVDVTTVCVTSCEGRPDGNYQSCHGCDVFASCSGGLLTDNLPCPDNNLQWDDRRKDCIYNSSTCPQTNSLTSSSTSGPAAQIGNFRCVSSCYGLPDGDFQSCLGCEVYATCSNGIISDNRPCPSGLVWDDSVKGCRMTSQSCGITTPTISTKVNVTVSSVTNSPRP